MIFLQKNFNYLFWPDLAGAHYSILAKKVCEVGWQASTQQELISRIQSQLKIIDSNFLQSLMGDVKTQMCAIADSGVPLKKKFNLTDNEIVK